MGLGIILGEIFLTGFTSGLRGTFLTGLFRTGIFLTSFFTGIGLALGIFFAGRGTFLINLGAANTFLTGRIGGESCGRTATGRPGTVCPGTII